uniref:Glucan endo-1,3-beta-glucosidase n=1 Tax=Anthurium amnicola TaxID=1678845 RepID=A0A1D1YC72_9ARAE
MAIARRAASPWLLSLPIRPLSPLPLMLLWLVSFNSGGNLLLGQAQKTWCVAKPSTDEAVLQQNIDFACSQVDCTILRAGCPCSYPNTRINHASITMNLYYQSKGCNYWNCHFKASGLIVQTDPSYGNCVYM